MTIAGSELLGTPLASSAVVVLLEDFEPSVTNGLVSDGIVDLLHVYCASTSVAGIDGAGLGSIRPVAELESHLRPCVCAANTRHAVHAIDAACHIVACNGGPDRAEGVSSFLDVVAHSDASAVTLIDIVDEKVRKSGMSADSGSSSQGQQDTVDVGEVHLGSVAVLLKGRVRLGLGLQVSMLGTGEVQGRMNESERDRGSQKVDVVGRGFG